MKPNSKVNSLGQECYEIVKPPVEYCPRVGESRPEINYWVKGDGCCEVKKSEEELCDPVDDEKAKTTTQKMTTKKTTQKMTTKKTTRKPSENDVDSGLLTLSL